MSESQEQLIEVEFTKPTLNYARGDIATVEQGYLDKVIKKYVTKNFEPDDRDRYRVLGNADKPAAPRAAAVTVAPKAPQAPSFESLKSQAVDLGIDVSNLRSKAAVQEAIDKALAEESV